MLVCVCVCVFVVGGYLCFAGSVVWFVGVAVVAVADLVKGSDVYTWGSAGSGALGHGAAKTIPQPRSIPQLHAKGTCNR